MPGSFANSVAVTCSSTRAVEIVGLTGHDVLDAGGFELLQRDRAVEAERRDRDVPVPAEMALRLAQHVAVGDR